MKGFDEIITRLLVLGHSFDVLVQELMVGLKFGMFIYNKLGFVIWQSYAGSSQGGSWGACDPPPPFVSFY